MIPRICLGLATVLLASCANIESVPRNPSASTSTATASDRGASSLAGIIATDPIEADLIAHPEDLRGLADHAVLLHQQSARSARPEEARELRRRARAFALAAIDGGSQDLFMAVLVEGIQPDGSLITTAHSSKAEADALTTTGEAKFARGDMQGALADYMAAWQLDTNSARIALFIGDVHFVNKDYAIAITWFDRAIALAPMAETAHRYRADALMRLRRTTEARDGYISAVLAEPYNPLPRRTLDLWAAKNGKALRHPVLSFGYGGLTVKNRKFEIGVDPSHGALSIVYGVGRAAYCSEHQVDPASYRHCLEEEAHALRLVMQTSAELRSSPESSTELAPHEESLKLLQQLIDRGLLEAHILLDRGNSELAGDYPAFRATHDDLLRRYVREIWFGEAPGSEP